MQWRCRRIIAHRRPHHGYFFLIDSESNDDQFGILYIASNSMHAKRLIRRQQTDRADIITAINDTLCQLPILKIHLFFLFFLSLFQM